MPTARKTQASPTRPKPKQEEKPKNSYGEREPGSLSGNLTRDPELRFTPSGKSVASFAIAVNERVQNEAGQWVDSEPEFWNCNAWGQLAENIAEYLDRGNRVVAVGYFQDRTFEDKDGNERTVTEFTAQELGPSMLWLGAKIVKAERTG